MKTKSEKVLHKMLSGTVHIQFVRCGKQNCKCAKGELHGAYYYHFVRVGGKLKKRYLKASDVELVKNACLARQQEKRSKIESSRAIWSELRELREQLRDLRNLYLLRKNTNAEKNLNKS